MPGNTAAAGIGHNVDPVEALKQGLKERYAKLANRVMELAEAQGRLPAKVEDEAAAARLGDFIQQCRAATKRLEAAHKVEKEDSLRVGQAVDEHFRTLRRMVEKVVTATTAVLQPFMDAQVAAERRRQEEAEAQRVAELKARAEAEAAQRKNVEEAEARAAAAAAEESRQAAEAAAAAAKASQGDDRHAAEAAAAELARRAEADRLEAEEAAKQAAAPPEAVEIAPAEIDPRVRIPGQTGRVLGKAVMTWEWQGDGPDKFDLNLVRAWIDPAAVSAALTAAVKAGATRLGPCVKVYETTKVVV